MIRSLAIPGLLVGLVLLPVLLPDDPERLPDTPDTAWSSATGSRDSNNPFQLLDGSLQSRTSPAGFPYRSGEGGAAPALNPAGNSGGARMELGAAALSPTPNAEYSAPVYDPQGRLLGYAPDPWRLGAIPTGPGSSSVSIPGDANGPDLSAPPMAFTPVTSFDEIFRFDVTADWIRNRWPRVSNTPSGDGFQGLRTALVTGTNRWDLHGSLTYYFDQRQRCQRIAFRGWSGDASQLIRFLEQRYGLERQSGNHDGYYLARSMFRRSGALLLKYPAVTYANDDSRQVALLMELNRPGASQSLSAEFERYVQESAGGR